jgi:hypothetical protein
MTFTRLASILLLMLLLVAGCAKPYKITQPLEEPLIHGSAVSIGPVHDALPPDMDEEDKPTEEHINKLRRYLFEELERKQLFDGVFPDSADTKYEVVGRMLTFKKGSGAVRFFIGFGLGDAEVTVGLELVEKETSEVKFAGNFKQVVSHWATSGDQVFRNVAKDFAKALEKNMKEL